MLRLLSHAASSAAMRVAVRPAATHRITRLALRSSSCAAIRPFSSDSSTPSPSSGPKSPAAHTASENDSIPAPTSNAQQPEQPKQEQSKKATGEDAAPAEPEQPKQQAPKQIMPATWSSFAFLALVGGAALSYFLYQQDKALNTVRTDTIGIPLLGGPWSLKNDKGERVTSDTYKGKYVLMYFGFTFCPDICPKELDRLDEVMKKLESAGFGNQVVPMFISLDPKRDTPARLSQYKLKWNPSIVWLTGTDEELASMAKAYRIYYSSSETTEGADDDYLIDHSIFFYLMDRENKFAEFFSSQNSPEDFAVRTAKFIAAENKKP